MTDDRRIHPNSIANLAKHQFKPGNPGPSRNGSDNRLPAVSITKALIELLRDEKIMDILVRSMIKHAAEKGDARILEMVWSRIDGIMAQKLEVSQPVSLSEAVLNVARTEPVLLDMLRARHDQIMAEARVVEEESPSAPAE